VRSRDRIHFLMQPRYKPMVCEFNHKNRILRLKIGVLLIQCQGYQNVMASYRSLTYSMVASRPLRRYETDGTTFLSLDTQDIGRGQLWCAQDWTQNPCVFNCAYLFAYCLHDVVGQCGFAVFVQYCVSGVSVFKLDDLLGNNTKPVASISTSSTPVHVSFNSDGSLLCVAARQPSMTLSFYNMETGNLKVRHSLLFINCTVITRACFESLITYTTVGPKGAFSLHRASGLPRTGRSRRTSYPQKWSEKRRRVRLERSLGHPTICLPETGWVWRPTHQPIKCSSTEYLAMFTPFRSHTRIIGKGNLFDFATIFTQLTARSCSGQRGNL